jgi:hypothetical protein
VGLDIRMLWLLATAKANPAEHFRTSDRWVSTAHVGSEVRRRGLAASRGLRTLANPIAVRQAFQPNK